MLNLTQDCILSMGVSVSVLKMSHGSECEKTISIHLLVMRNAIIAVARQDLL